MQNFYDWYLETNRQLDISEQKKLVEIAKPTKDFYLNKLDKLPKGCVFLSKKLLKNIQEQFRGQLRPKDIIGILDEILDENNSSAALLWCKSVRKQGVEKLQRIFLKENYGINILSGKKNGVTPSGSNSFRFNLETGDFVQGQRKIPGKFTKSMDGYFFILCESVLIKVWIFQKVTTDNGGGTDNVEEEVIQALSTIKKFKSLKKTSDKFVFLLDGPFYQRKQYKTDKTTRFERIYDLSDNDIIVATSDSLKSELSKRNLVLK